MSSHPTAADTIQLHPGDRVRIGAGRKEWVVEGFWTAPASGDLMASLQPVDGYTTASAPVTRLTLVSKP